jgi:hypothetical protein
MDGYKHLVVRCTGDVGSMAARSRSRGVNGAGDSQKGRRKPVSRKFGVVDGLFEAAIEIKRSLYFTMAAKTFYVQGEASTVSTNAIGSVRLDLDTGEAVAALDFGPEDEGDVTDEFQKAAEAQLEVFRKAVEGLVNRKQVKRRVSAGEGKGTRRSNPGASGENHWRRRKARAEAALIGDSEGPEGVPLGNDPFTVGGVQFTAGDDPKAAKLKAQREREALRKREKRAQARATKGERPGGAEAEWMEYSNPQELDQMLDGTPENDPELAEDTAAAQEYDAREAAGELTDDERAIYGDGDDREAEWDGSEGPVEEGALG